VGWGVHRAVSPQSLSQSAQWGVLGSPLLLTDRRLRRCSGTGPVCRSLLVRLRLGRGRCAGSPAERGCGGLGYTGPGAASQPSSGIPEGLRSLAVVRFSRARGPFKLGAGPVAGPGIAPSDLGGANSPPPCGLTTWPVAIPTAGGPQSVPELAYHLAPEAAGLGCRSGRDGITE
jgi:hypothetical protein